MNDLLDIFKYQLIALLFVLCIPGPFPESASMFIYLSKKVRAPVRDIGDFSLPYEKKPSALAY